MRLYLIAIGAVLLTSRNAEAHFRWIDGDNVTRTKVAALEVQGTHNYLVDSHRLLVHNVSGQERATQSRLQKLLSVINTQELQGAVAEWIKEMLALPKHNELLHTIATTSDVRTRREALNQLLKDRVPPEKYARALGTIFLQGSPNVKKDLMDFYSLVGYPALRGSLPILLESYSRHLELTPSPVAITNLEALLLHLPTDMIGVAVQENANTASYLRMNPKIAAKEKSAVPGVLIPGAVWMRATIDEELDPTALHRYQEEGILLQGENGTLWALAARHPGYEHPNDGHGRSLHTCLSAARLLHGDFANVFKGGGSAVPEGGRGFWVRESELEGPRRYRGAEERNYSARASRLALWWHKVHAAAMEHEHPMVLAARKYNATDLRVMKPTLRLRAESLPVVISDRLELQDASTVFRKAGFSKELASNLVVSAYDVRIAARMSALRGRNWKTDPIQAAPIAAAFGVEYRDELSKSERTKIVQHAAASFAVSLGHLHEAGGAISSDHSEPDVDNQTQAAELLDLDSATLPYDALPSYSTAPAAILKSQERDQQQIENGIILFANYWDVDKRRGLKAFEEIYSLR